MPDHLGDLPEEEALLEAGEVDEFNKELNPDETYVLLEQNMRIILNVFVRLDILVYILIFWDFSYCMLVKNFVVHCWRR